MLPAALVAGGKNRSGSVFVVSRPSLFPGAMCGACVKSYYFTKVLKNSLVTVVVGEGTGGDEINVVVRVRVCEVVGVIP